MNHTSIDLTDITQSTQPTQPIQSSGPIPPALYTHQLSTQRDENESRDLRERQKSLKLKEKQEYKLIRNDNMWVIGLVATPWEMWTEIRNREYDTRQTDNESSGRERPYRSIRESSTSIPAFRFILISAVAVAV